VCVLVSAANFLTCFCQSLCLWNLKRFDDAVCTLGESDLRSSDSQPEAEDPTVYPQLLHLFCSLSKVSHVRIAADQKQSIENELRARTVQAYSTMGCAVLAAQQLALLLESRSNRHSPDLERQQEIREHDALFSGDGEPVSEEPEGSKEEEESSVVNPGGFDAGVLGGFGGASFGMLGSSPAPVAAAPNQYDFLGLGGSSTASEPSTQYDFLNTSSIPAATAGASLFGNTPTLSSDDNKYDFLSSPAPSSAAGLFGSTPSPAAADNKYDFLGLGSGSSDPVATDAPQSSAPASTDGEEGELPGAHVEAGLVHSVALQLMVSRLAAASSFAGPLAVSALLFERTQETAGVPATEFSARSDLSVLCEALCISKRRMLGLLHAHFSGLLHVFLSRSTEYPV
jgi:hypothetical protein